MSKISRLEPIVFIGQTLLDEQTLKNLIELVDENKRLKQQMSKVLTEFKAMKDVLAKRSTNLAELETVCANMVEDVKDDSCHHHKQQEWHRLVGMDVDEAVKIIRCDCPGAFIQKVPPNGFIAYVYQFNRVCVLHDENNKVLHVPEFG